MKFLTGLIGAKIKRMCTSDQVLCMSKVR